MAKKILYSLFILVNVAFVSQAQQDTNLIEQITITQDRIRLGVKEQSRQVVILDKKAISLAPAQSLPELLQYLTGVDIRRRGPMGVQADITLRGGTFEQVLILINGVRMNDAQTGHHSSYIPFDVSQIEKIEIVKGGASRIFGQNAYTGAINIITKTSDQSSIILDAGYSAFNTMNLGLSASVPSGPWRQNISATHARSDGYRENTDFTTNNIYYQADTKIGDHRLDFFGGFTERKFGANGFYASPAFMDQYEEVQTSIIAATANIKIAQSTYLKPKLSWRRNQDMYLFLRQDPSYYRNMHIGNNVNAELHLSHQNRIGSLGLGIDVASQRLRSNNLGSHQRMIYGLFAEQNIVLASDKLSMTGGLYGQYIADLDAFQIYPGIDMGYQVNNNWKIFATTGYNNRVPSYTDLYYTSPSEQGSQDLQPESSWDAAIGVNGRLANNTVSASVFRRQSSNAIDWGKDSLTQQKWIVNNLNGLTVTGIELLTTVSLSNNISWKLQYTYLDNVIATDGNAISRYTLDNLRHQFGTGLNSFWLENKFNASIFARYNVRNTSEALSTVEEFGSHYLMDAKISYQWKSLTLSLTGNNLTNATYIETSLVPMPGRWIGGQVRLVWSKK